MDLRRRPHAVAARAAAILALAALAAPLCGCGHGASAEPVAAQGPGIEVLDPYVSAPAGHHEAAVYLTLVSTARAGDTLERVTSPAAREVLVVSAGRRSGVTTFASVAEVRVPGRRTVRLVPGGLHVLLIRPRRPLDVGDTVPVTLVFARAGRIAVTVPVVAPSG